MAISTVADFERGSRTPIANSIDAITAALEAGGLRFVDGRAILESATGTPADLATGAPYRWVDAGDLGEWANRLDAQADLPELIERLIRATVGSSATLHFPAAESVQRGGWDGTCKSPTGQSYVPVGFSGWELTTQRDKIDKKADSDFDKRAASSGVDPATTTFVFVVARNWPNKERWLIKQRAKGLFADVQALDVDALVHWLDTDPNTQIWLAKKIGKHPRSGVASLEEAWLRWSLGTKPPLTERFILAGRDEEATAVRKRLNADPSVLTIRASSADEAAAFIWAAISDLPKPVRDVQRGRALYAGSDDAARELAVALKPLIIVMNGESVGFAELVASKGHHVFAVVGSDVSATGGISLDRVRRVDIEEGLEAAGLAPSKARVFAHRSGGSIPALRRIMEGTTPLPSWAAAPSRSILAALLIGAWDEGSEADRTIIADLAGKPYDDVARDLAAFTNGLDTPLRRSGKKMRLASGQDAWYLLARQLTDADIEQFFKVALGVLCEIDPRFEREDRSRLIMYGEAMPRHSRELRRGIVEMLDIMASFADCATNIQFLADRVSRFVALLFKDADAALWWSLRDSFPGLAEAAPHEFLTAVDVSLEMNEKPIAALMASEGRGLFSREYISDLTSALERLAWSSDYFTDAVMALAGLANIDSGETKNGNRPAATLRKIFMPWVPQTYVSLHERLGRLDQIRERYPSVAWDLMLELMPKNWDSSSYSSEPRWRLVSDERRESPKPDELKKSADEVLTRLLDDAGADVERWIALLGALTALEERRQREVTIKLLDAMRLTEDDEDKRRARIGLRKALHRQRQFAHTDWAIPESALAPLQAAYDLLTPADIIEREDWVFAAYPEPPDPTPGHDLQLMEAQNEENRRRVARDLMDAGGLESILAMTVAVEAPLYLGIALMEVGIDDKLRDALLHQTLHSGDTKLGELARGMVIGGKPLGDAWVADVIHTAVKTGGNARSIALALHGLEASTFAWGLAHDAGTDVEREYWTMMHVYEIRGDSPSVAVKAFLRFSRGTAAVALMGQRGADQFDVSLALQALQDAGKELVTSKQISDSSMLGHYVGLVLDRVVADESVPREELVKLEWTFFGLLRHSDRKSTILGETLASSPDFFNTIISSIYPGDDEEVDETDEEAMHRKRAVAEQSYSLLNQWSTIPGAGEDATIDAVALNAWVNEARAQATASKRIRVVDDRIGAMLSAAKPEANGDWPPKPIRDLIERLRSKELDIGIIVGAVNRRGTTTRGPLDGGEQERNLQVQYESLAKKFRVSSPRTASILRQIGDDYKYGAVVMDELAEHVDSL